MSIVEFHIKADPEHTVTKYWIDGKLVSEKRTPTVHRSDPIEFTEEQWAAIEGAPETVQW